MKSIRKSLEEINKKVKTMSILDSQEPKSLGYEEFTTLLSDYTVIRFSVPNHEWSKLRESKEWNDFQSLFEKSQKEYIQKKHLAVECL